MPQSMVHIENLVKRYGDLTALNHLELDIREGEIFGLLGPNGSGKTTAISCLLSLLKYDRGEIKIFGEEMKPDSYKLKEQIGIVLQNVAVFDELTVQENIDYFCGLYIRDRKQRKELVDGIYSGSSVVISEKEGAKGNAGCNGICTVYPVTIPGTPHKEIECRWETYSKGYGRYSK